MTRRKLEASNERTHGLQFGRSGSAKVSGSCVIMVGPSPAACGGIASVAATLLAEPALERFGIEYVTTAAEGSLVNRAWQSLHGLVRFVRLVRAECVVHVHLSSKGSLARKAVVVFVARAKGARVLVHLHGSEFHKFVRRSIPPVRAIARWVFRVADEVVVLSAVWQSRVESLSGRSDAIILPNPVSVPEKTASMDGDVTVLFLGRLGGRKGAPELLEAISRLQQGGSRAQWVLAGDGDLSRFRDLAARLPLPELVRVPGWLSRPQTEEALLRSWVFCLPSHDEGKPVALLEAMAFGLACVATPVGGVPELIIEGETGLLVPPGDPIALASALESLLGSRERCLDLGTRARLLVEDTYSSSRVGEQLAVIYDRLLQGARP